MNGSVIPRFCILLLALTVFTNAQGQTHFANCSRNTGSSATLVLPTEATFLVNGNELSVRDEIAVFAPDGRCTGVTTWTGSNVAINIWGDDGLTSEVEGHLTGQPLTLRVWDADGKAEYPSATGTATITLSDEKPYYQSENVYRANAIMVLSAAILSESSGHSHDLREGAVKTTTLEAAPSDFQLGANYPNPFNSSTTLSFSVEKTAPVTITVYDTLGREVAVPVAGVVEVGRHDVRWNAGDLPTGGYVVRMEMEGRIQSRVLSVLK